MGGVTQAPAKIGRYIGIQIDPALIDQPHYTQCDR
jgi:hypothetical protein